MVRHQTQRLRRSQASCWVLRLDAWQLEGPGWMETVPTTPGAVVPRVEKRWQDASAGSPQLSHNALRRNWSVLDRLQHLRDGLQMCKGKSSLLARKPKSKRSLKNVPMGHVYKLSNSFSCLHQHTQGD